MKEIIMKMPYLFDDGWHVLNLRRGQERRMSYHLIIVETLRSLGDQRPTRDQLQKCAKIRRKQFVAVLKYLLETRSVERIGGGTRFVPYLYVLGEKERRR